MAKYEVSSRERGGGNTENRFPPKQVFSTQLKDMLARDRIVLQNFCGGKNKTQ